MEAAAAHGVSWWLVQRALNMSATRFPAMDKLRPRMLGIDEHRSLSVRFFKDPGFGCRAPPCRSMPSTWSWRQHAHGSPPAPDTANQGPARTHADPVWANSGLLLRAGETLSDRGYDRLKNVFYIDDPTGTLQAVWNVKEQLRTLLRTGSLEDADAAKRWLKELDGIAVQPETNRLWHMVCRWWNGIEVLIVTGATTAKVEVNDTAIKQLKRTGSGFVNSRNYTPRIMLRSAARTAT